MRSTAARYATVDNFAAFLAGAETGGGSAAAPTERATFLLEIGSEEIPARFIPDSRRELEGRAAALFAELHLEHGALRSYATPRRLALLVDDLACRQPDREIEVKGPPVSVAFAEDGSPTRAAEGFARKNGVALADCQRARDQRGEYLLVRKVVAGQPAAEVLADALAGLILGLPFRKVMRWGSGEVEYARPLRWLMALLGDAVVPLSCGDLTAGRTTRGHRTLSADAEIDVARPEDYLELLRGVGVIADPRERETIIVEGARTAVAALPGGGVWREDADLLLEVVYLCEHPTVFIGTYSEDFFDLPPEVIVTALKAHQRYFAVDAGEDGSLCPYFLFARDGGQDHRDIVIAGNERVLRARLADALFYWRFDQQRSPDEQASALAAVTWLEGYGSMRDKSQRVAKLLAWLWEKGLGDGGPLPPAAARAAAIAKADLVSEMIKDGKEFTKLEGLIGARYAAAAGEEESVCRAIERHYYPRAAGGELPGDRISSLLSVADRLDTMTGCWLAGFVPTGAKDPYGLRRHALAILRIVLDLRARLDLRAAFGAALAQYGHRSGESELASVAQQLLTFTERRLAGLLVEGLGHTPAVVRAVLPERGHDPTDALAWIKALEEFREEENFLLLATGFKRCANILEGQLLTPEERQAALQRWLDSGTSPAESAGPALTEAAENILYQKVVAATPLLVAAEEAGQYNAVFEQLSALGPAIDDFFDSVRVNVEDQDLRARRHAFLRDIHALFARYADFSAVAPGSEAS